MRALMTCGTLLNISLQPYETRFPQTGLVELAIGEEITMLGAMLSHMQEQAMFLKREGDRCKQEHLGNINCNQGLAWQ